ncbi:MULTISPECIES: oxygenase MpaB family protein [Gordonia]|nr:MULTISPECIES: oxygenase MpaB family protein [Gordonia]
MTSHDRSGAPTVPLAEQERLSGDSVRRVAMPMIYHYLGDKRFTYALPRALALQILHPGNAAGLVQHVHGGLWAHKQRSVGQMVYIAYSNRDLRSVMRSAHVHVKGKDSSGARYHALNPELFHFQHATYVDALFFSIEHFHHRLSAGEKEELYRQCCLWYGKYDISDRAVPATYGEFQDYLEDYCARELRLSPEAAQLREQVLNPNTWYPRKVPTAAIRAMLHPRAAELLDIAPSGRDRASLAAFAAKAKTQAALSSAHRRLIPPARHDPDS